MRALLEGCDVARSEDDNVSIGRGASVVVTACKIHQGKAAGIIVMDDETVCRLEGNEIWSNAQCGIYCGEGGDPLLTGNTIRDHEEDSDGEQEFCGAGLYVAADAAGCATVRPDNVFEQNELGDVVRA